MNARTGSLDAFTLEHKFTVEEGPIYLTGMQSLVRLMLDQRRADQRAGLNTAGFVCGYPGSPVGGVDGEMQRARKLLDAHHIVHQPGLNEELAATAAFGTQMLHEVPGARYDGVFAMWYGKAPGVERTGDAFHHHNWRGVGRNGGVLAVAGDDPHARSTIWPSDSNNAFYKWYMPLLAPGNIQEVLDYGLHGYALSRAAGLWVGFKFVTDVADSAATAWVAPDRIRPVIPEVMLDGQKLEPKLRTNEVAGQMIEMERRIYYGYLEVARRYAALNGLNRIVVDPPQARIGIMAGGKTWYDLRQALADLGLDDAALEAKGIRLLKMGMLFPVEPEIVRTFARGLEELIVVEDKRPFLEMFVKDLLYSAPERPRISGKSDPDGKPLLTAHGELSPDLIARALLARLGPLADGPQAQARARQLNAAARTPIMLSSARSLYFCSGCPHNTGLKLPDGAIVGAGIGCHIMGLWLGKGYGTVKGYTQMGGEGTPWIGVSPFTDTRHFYQNLGDGTFAHSGSLAIRFAIASGANITYKLLVNGTVAMTGGQDVQGGMSIPSMVTMLEAEGVKRIIITTDDITKYPQRKVSRAEVWARERIIEAEQVLAATPGVTVLLHDQMCATQKRRMRKRGRMGYGPKSAIINQRVCEGCGDCGEKSNCLSVQPVQTEFGRKTQIHQSSCNQDLSCVKGDCPSFATVEPRDTVRRDRKARDLPLPEDFRLPDPVAKVPTDAFEVCLMGIGGTGVVTVNQVLGTAAFLSGRRVQTYDHTGSSQKAGPVISHLKVVPRDGDRSPTVGNGSADLYLVFDALTAVAAPNIALTSAQRTVAIVSTTQVPTGEMVTNRDKRYPDPGLLRDTIDATTRAADNLYVDAQACAEGLFGDHMASNLFLVGVAVQHGALPIPPEAIEEAIALNGIAVQMNVQALRWGRAFVADRARVEKAMKPVGVAPAAAVPLDPRAAALVERTGATGELRRLLEVRVSDLIGYQNVGYAQRYLDRVTTLLAAERPVSGGSTAFTEAAARGLHKLMAAKDEYEVARLLLDDGERARLRDTFGEGARVRWHLHPTFLRRLGVHDKVALGEWFTPVLKMLRAAKSLRGTPLDLFARTRIRGLERALLVHYEALLDALRGRLTSANLPQATALAALPDMVRGYEDVKERGIRAYLVAVRDAGNALGVGGVPLPAELAALRDQAPAAQPQAA